MFTSGAFVEVEVKVEIVAMQYCLARIWPHDKRPICRFESGNERLFGSIATLKPKVVPEAGQRPSATIERALGLPLILTLIIAAVPEMARICRRQPEVV